MKRTIFLISLLMGVCSIAAAGPPPSPAGTGTAVTTAPADSDYATALLLIKEGRNTEALPLLERALKRSPGDVRLQADYLLCLTWTGAYRQAVDYYREREPQLRQIPYVPRHVARAYYELRDYPQALALYRAGLAVDPTDGESFKGIIFTQLRMGEPTVALASFNQGISTKNMPPQAIEAARSALLEQYGASFGAMASARQAGSTDEARLESLAIDQAAMKLRWDETDAAVADLEQILARNPDNQRARGDYIAALRKQGRMTDALRQFELYRASGRSVPPWLNEAVADAHAALRNPAEADRYYLLALQQEPDNLDCLMGRFAARMELRDWDGASRVLDEVDALRRSGKNPAATEELITARGWLLLATDRPLEAEDYFNHYLNDAAADTGLRSGLAYSYAWSNRPRSAREQFEIIRNQAPEDQRNQVSLAGTLNDLNHKQQARDMAAALPDSNPPRAFITDFRETLRVEDMWRLQPEFRLVDEFGDAREYWLSLLLEKPVTPVFSVFGTILRQEATARNVQSDSWDRFGLGFRWIATPDVILTQSVSFDYRTGDDAGSDTRVTWTPTDPLTMSAEYSSFSLSVPLRARVAGITAQLASAAVAWRTPDETEYGASAGAQWFSDSNAYRFGALRYEQGLYTEPDLRIRGGAELSVGSYTKQDVSYFSPDFEWSGLLTSKIRNLLLVRGEQKWLSDIMLRGGLRGQSSYDPRPTAGITYEQSYQHSKRLSLTGNVSYDLRVYDGAYTNAVGTYLTLDWRF